MSWGVAWPRSLRSVVLGLASPEIARGPAYDLVPAGGHPELQPGVTGILRRGRPDRGPVRAAIGPDADQIEGFRAFLVLGGWVVLKQDEGGPYRRVSSAQMGPADSVTESADPVSVTMARRPGSGPAVSQTRR